VVARERRQARALATNFNIIAIDLKSKRQLSQPTRYGKGCKKMRKLSHRAASTFTRLAFLYSDATAVARGYRNGTRVTISGRILFQSAHISANEFYENSFCSFN